MKGPLKAVNREHLGSECIRYMKSFIEAGGKCPKREEWIAWVVKTYEEKGEPYYITERFGKDLKCERVVKRYHKVLREGEQDLETGKCEKRRVPPCRFGVNFVSPNSEDFYIYIGCSCIYKDTYTYIYSIKK
tara:strand:- start:10 stop:405 length:396 start_codon:yes stop_codon:yes gene_type:complete